MRIALFLLALALFALSPRVAVAQTAAAGSAEKSSEGAGEEQKRKDAKERFLKGLGLANAGDWDAALVEFLASIDTFPTRVAMTNAAISLRNLKRYAEAAEMHRKLLQRYGEQLSADDRRANEEAIAELRGYIGAIDVETTVKGAVVVVDGQERGRTPLTEPIAVNAGTHSVRIFKDGFQPFELQVAVAGKQTKAVNAKLTPLVKSGTLVVNEAEGQSLDVLVDGAVVGKTPWQGSVSVGVHTVALQGAGDLGTPPSSASVRENQSTALSLRAARLDAELRVEPVPSNARVFVDGVLVGSGVWQGRLASGRHRVEVAADGHAPFRGEKAIDSGKRELVRVTLERDLDDPMWGARFRPHPYAEALVGMPIVPSLGGDADESCGKTVPLPDGSSAPGCSEKPIGLGIFAAVRGGYQLTKSLGVELLGGYVHFSERRKRAIVADVEGTPYGSRDYDDRVSFSGPLAALSAAYGPLDWLTGRIAAGVVRAKVQGENGGTFSGVATHDDDPSVEVQVRQKLSVPELALNVWVPFVAPEIQARYRLSKLVSLEFGVMALIAILPPETPRTGVSPFAGTESAPGERIGITRAVPGGFMADVDADGAPDDVPARSFSLPREEALGTFVAVTPTAGVRLDF